MRLRACVGCLGPGTSPRGQPNLGSLLGIPSVLLAASCGFQNLSSQAEKFTRNGFSVKILLPARVDKESFLGRGTNGRQLGLHWRCTGIYFVFGVNGYLAGLVSLQQ